jgi:hypothetical protein
MTPDLARYPGDGGELPRPALCGERIGARGCIREFDSWRVPLTPMAPQMLGVDDPLIAQWLADRMRPHHLNTYRTPIASEHAANTQLPHHYVHPTKGPTAPMFSRFAGAAKSRGWRTHECEPPHDAMLTNPKELTDVLLRTAAE